MASIQPQQSTTSIASFGVMDFRLEATLWILIHTSSARVVVLAQPFVEGVGVLELVDLLADRR